MTISKLGLKGPDTSELFATRAVYNEETGMSATLWTDTFPAKHSSVFYVTTEHEDVGLVTFYQAATFEEADSFVSQIKEAEA